MLRNPNFIKRDRLKLWIKALQSALVNPDRGQPWPLRRQQMTCYFEDLLTADIFEKVELMKKKRTDLKMVAGFFGSHIALKNLILTFTDGLKTAHNAGWFKTNNYQRLAFFNYLFDVLDHLLLRYDIFKADKQLAWPAQDLEPLPWKSAIALNEDSRSLVGRLNESLRGLTRALFFDPFAFVGSNFHGNYVPRYHQFKFKASFFVNEYFNLNPFEIWPDINLSFTKVQVLNVYENHQVKMDFLGRPIPDKKNKERHRFSLILVDGHPVAGLSRLKQLLEEIEEQTALQVERVTGMDPLDIVKKAAQIHWFHFRNLHSYFERDWRPPAQVNQAIDRFGEKLMAKYARKVSLTPAQVKQKFDPRNND